MAKLETLKQLFEGKIFRIPDYQRGYSWQKDQLKDLWDDLKNIDLNIPNSYHFAGVVTVEPINKAGKEKLKQEGICFDEKENPIIDNQCYTSYYVVDGQQRLTSILLLLKEIADTIDNDTVNYPDIAKQIRSLYKNKENICFWGYEKDVPSQIHLSKKLDIEGFEDKDETHTNYTKNLDDAVEFFSTELGRLSEQDRLELFTKIIERLLFYYFEIDTSKLNVSMVFETMNNRGIQLSKLELLKNRLIYIVSKKATNSDFESLKEQIIQTWLYIYEWLGKNDSKIMIDDDFLRAFYVVYFVKDDKLPEKELTKYEKGIFDEIFTLEKCNIKDIPQILDDLKIAIKAWFIINNPKDENSQIGLSRKTIHLLDVINQNKSGNFTKIFLLAGLMNRHKNPYNNRFEDVVEAIERHNFCVYYLNGNRTNNNRAELLRLAHKYYTGERQETDLVEDINDLVRNCVKYERTKQTLRENIGGQYFYSWEGLKYFLWEWEYYLQGNDDARLTSYGDCTPSLIFPEDSSLKDEFKDCIKGRSKDNINKIRYSLGNIVLAKTKRKDASYKNQKQYYEDNKTSVSYSEYDLYSTFDKWNDETILNRGQRMIDFMLNRWKIHHIERENISKLLIENIHI